MDYQVACPNCRANIGVPAFLVFVPSLLAVIFGAMALREPIGGVPARGAGKGSRGWCWGFWG